MHVMQKVEVVLHVPLKLGLRQVQWAASNEKNTELAFLQGGF